MHKCSYMYLDICATRWSWLRAAEEGPLARLAGRRARLGGLAVHRVQARKERLAADSNVV